MDENNSETIDVIAKLTPEAAASGTSQHGVLQSRATELGITLEPLHPSASDPELSTYFIVRVDPASRERVVEQLLGLDDVEGAYVKPRGEPPEGSF